jgi:ketosteroid isomerase-like protein
MSEENVGIIVEAFRFFDIADWDSYGEFWAEEAELWPPDGWPEPGPFEGRQAIVKEWARVREDWSVSRVTVEDHTERGDRLVARFRWVAEGASSHFSAKMEVSGACRFENGRIAELRFFWNHGDALEAAGLRE